MHDCCCFAWLLAHLSNCSPHFSRSIVQVLPLLFYISLRDHIFFFLAGTFDSAMAFAIRYPIGLFFGLAVSVQSFHVNRALYVSSLHHYQERAGLHATIVTSSNGEAANTAREVEADLFQADLNRVGLSLCHGILHASGCRRLSDLRELTSAQIMTMGADAFDRPVIRRVMDDLEKIQTDRCNGGGADSNVSNDVSSTAANLSTLVDGAFVSTTKTRSRFEEETKREFDLEVICAENDIFKGRLFTPEECAQLNRMSEYHAYKGTGTVGAGWTNEIYTLTAQHMACESVPGFLSTTDGIFRQLVRELYSLYPERVRKGSIEFESSGEPHLVKYNGKARGTVLHTDNDDEYASTSITINALLSASDDFGGGGTYITAIDRTVQLKQGEMLIHLGNLEHAGAEITFGVRRLLVAFLACEWEDSSY